MLRSVPPRQIPRPIPACGHNADAYPAARTAFEPLRQVPEALFRRDTVQFNQVLSAENDGVPAIFAPNAPMAAVVVAALPTVALRHSLPAGCSLPRITTYGASRSFTILTSMHPHWLHFSRRAISDTRVSKARPRSVTNPSGLITTVRPHPEQLTWNFML